MTTTVVEVHGLSRRHGEVDALVDVDLQVQAGTVLGVLGHNGAGKTTLIDILSTRIRPSGGSVRICGLDVVADAAEVRSRIGVVNQFTALDGALTGRQNLMLVARLLGADRDRARARVDDLIEVFDLTAADRDVRTWSGGMRRRLDLAAGLLGAPDVLFLDEPTTGLDPSGRADLWRVVQGIVEAGTALVLTTQYLEEADRLADDIVVLGRGRVVTTGTPAQLKARLGRRTVTVTLGGERSVAHALGALTAARIVAAGHGRTVVAPIDEAGQLTAIVRALDGAGILISDLTVAEPTLDDVFMALDARPPDPGPVTVPVTLPDRPPSASTPRRPSPSPVPAAPPAREHPSREQGL